MANPRHDASKLGHNFGNTFWKHQAQALSLYFISLKTLHPEPYTCPGELRQLERIVLLNVGLRGTWGKCPCKGVIWGYIGRYRIEGVGFRVRVVALLEVP